LKKRRETKFHLVATVLGGRSGCGGLIKKKNPEMLIDLGPEGNWGEKGDDLRLSFRRNLKTERYRKDPKKKKKKKKTRK